MVKTSPELMRLLGGGKKMLWVNESRPKRKNYYKKGGSPMN